MATASLGAVVGYLRQLGESHGPTLSDHELVERFTRARDEAAFTELVRRHGPMVLGTCRQVLRHEQDAEDSFQAAFLVLARKACSIHRRDSVGGWLFQVARRLALRARTVRQRRREQPLPPESQAVFWRRGEGGATLGDELGHLPDCYRSVLVLCYLEGRTQPEAARLLGTTADAVNSRLKRAREMLRQRLARRGLVLSAAALVKAFTTGTARAGLSAELVRRTTRAALHLVLNRTASGASALSVALAKGACDSMKPLKLKLLAAGAMALVLAAVGTLLLGPSALGDSDDSRAAPAAPPQAAKAPAGRLGKGKVPRSCIILWMTGGPSQIDTFDPKPGRATGGKFRAINTTIKGVQISEHLPRLAKLTGHLAIVRSLTHGEGDHARGTLLMRTGHSPDGTDYPTLGCLLAKELGADRPDLPPYVSIAATRLLVPAAYSSGPLGPHYAPLMVAERKFGGDEAEPDAVLRLPAEEDFKALTPERRAKMRQAVARAFDLRAEKPAVRDAYGRTLFGQGCLLARRLVQAGVPVVEVTLPGWDTHRDNFNTVQALSGELDAAWAALLKDLHKSKRLENTLVVWMGEFGRTPRINDQGGRDHHPAFFTVVLGGCGIKGGQVIGKTDADGESIVERPVTPPELLSTIYQAVGIDPAREYRIGGRRVPFVDREMKAVKEALR
jgi:RNA polymerase sigma factor (sigma-70 family)